MRGYHAGAQKIWVISHGPDCSEKWKPGTVLYVKDGFELEQAGGLDLWEDFKDDPAFESLRKFSEETESEVITKLTFESSVVAIEE